jgi:micrococcal nuclease
MTQRERNQNDDPSKSRTSDWGPALSTVHRRITTASGVVSALLVLAMAAGIGWAMSLQIEGVDGDSVHLASGTLARIRGIDTPAADWRAKCPAERELGERAKARMAELAARPGVRAVPTVKREKFGRPLVRLIGPDGREIGETSIAEGLARAYQGGKREGWCPRDNR